MPPGCKNERPAPGRRQLAGFLLIAASVACSPGSEAMKISPEASRAGTCSPTIARMVPPQFVLDYVQGGMSNEHPERSMSAEAFAARNNYLGNDSMWLALPHDGRVRGTSLSVTAIQTVSERIEVTAERIGGPTGEVRFERDENSLGGPRDRAVTIHFSVPGCWEVTYRLGTSQLRFIVLVESASR